MVTNQPSAARSGRSAGGEAGFTLLAVLIAVAVINIALGVAAVKWSTFIKRQREIELVWRGEQYARALECYRQQEGTLPTELAQLVEARCLRRLYADPVSQSGRWRVIRAAELTPSQAEAALGGNPQTSPAEIGTSEAEAAPDSGRGLRQRLGAGTSRLRQRLGSRESRLGQALSSSRLGQRLGSGASGLRPESAAETGMTEADRGGGLAARLRSRRSARQGLMQRRTAGEMRGEAADQIVGVVSTSSAEALRARAGGRRYDEWRFMAGSAPPPPIPTWVPDEDPESLGEGQSESSLGSRLRGLRSRRRDAGGTSG